MTHIDEKHIDIAENFVVTIPMYNLIEYNDIHSGTSGSLWLFKKDESPINEAGNPDNASTNNSSSFKI